LSSPSSYRDAGVDIDAGNRLVERIKPLARSTTRPEVHGGIGGFSALVSLPAKYREPLLVSSTDGVGTKLKVALAAQRHHTIGIDLVAMCVNDMAVVGAEPLFFLDYYATSKLNVDVAAAVIEGIAEGCRQAGCALVGGETAELPGMYQPGEYDLAGFSVGVVERSQLVDGSKVGVGDAIVGIASSGLHSNGYSLARRVLVGDGSEAEIRAALATTPPLLGGESLGEQLLRPTRIYVRALRGLMAQGVDLHGCAHITGGGLVENPPRLLAGTPAAQSLGMRIQLGSWPEPPIFALLRSQGAIDEHEMRRTFNLGIGMVCVLPRAQVHRAIELLRSTGEQAFAIGEIIHRAAGDHDVMAFCS
jgi:phosphoribosylformylglycinamidine cyclo-ligase